MEMRNLVLAFFILSSLPKKLAAANLCNDTYLESCPSAEGTIIRSALRELYASNASIVPALLRLAFHDCFVMVGGEYYPVLTGRRDSKMAFLENAILDIPSPGFSLSKALESFAAKGFDVRETVALLGGGHSTGTIHCDFIRSRFGGTSGPDPSIDPQFLEFLISECNRPASPSLPSEFENRGLRKELRWITNAFIDAYASDNPLLRRDFGFAMIKLSNLGGADDGEVRRDCRIRNKQT